MHVGIIGIGYVGLPTAVCLASFGHRIVCIDTNTQKIKNLENGEMPIYEKGLYEILESYRENIKFSTDYEDLKDTDIIIIAVGTPQSESGEADLSYLYSVAKSLKITESQVIAIKSTVPVGTNDNIREIIKQNNKANFHLVSMPEFLREGYAVEDFLNPDRIIVGSRIEDYDVVQNVIYALYPAHYANRMLFTDVKSAELIKYASNAFLATKIHFINEIANLCEKVNADVNAVAQGMGLDNRIGSKFLSAGVGFGGSCFPKDTVALFHTALEHDVFLSIVDSVIRGNNFRKLQFAQKILKKIWGTKNPVIAFMGIAFKSGTDDCRESSAIAMIKYIQQQNKTARIRCYDKLAIENAKKLLENVEFTDNIMEAAENADLIIIMNEDEEFIQLSLLNKTIFDFRGIMPYKQNIYKIGVHDFDA